MVMEVDGDDDFAEIDSDSSEAESEKERSGIGEQLDTDEMVSSSDSLATRDYLANEYSSRTGESERRPYNGNIEEAESSLREGIYIGSVTSKMKFYLTRRVDRRKRHSKNDVAPLMSVHTISLHFEAIYLEAKLLEVLRRYKEAAQSCKALLYHWNLDTDIETRIQKEFVIFLLYSGSDTTPPNLRSQVEGLFVPKNNIEEAVILLMIMLRKSVQKRIKFNAYVADHLSYSLPVVGELRGLACQIEEILPRDLDRDERYYSLALCYCGEGEDLVCGENSERAEEGVSYARKALSILQGGCSDISDVANFLPGISLSSHARISAVSNSEKTIRYSQVLEALEIAEREMRETDLKVIFHLTLENTELRKLDVAFCYAKVFLRLQVESDVKGWVFLARILSAQKEFKDAEIVINNALKETGKWDQGELLRT
ncbi:hypothetical protein GIB67_005344 [Kingdonia uniflora]|uniref:Uncharacterized protein n=1 Tax=Kingdonia uniflora TaxID=39325 RepID=A0A7J7NCT5_9MAGN|nr:hypothetical protein GIB67_005344 [Kingdonia uniflora]